MPESARSCPASAGADSSSSRWSAKPTCTMTYSPTCDVGHVLQAHLLAHAAEVDLGHPRAVPVLRSRAPCRVRPGTWRLLPVRRSVNLRDWPDGSTWPSARPPSLGGTCRWRRTVKPSVPQRRRGAADSSSALANTPPDRATVSDAGRSSRHRRSQVDDQARPRARVEARARSAPAGTPRAGRATTARDHRRRVGRRAGPARPRETERVGAAVASSVAGERPPARWPPVPRSPRRGRRRPARTTASKSRPMLEVGTQPSPVSSWCASTPALVARAGAAPAAGRRPTRRRRPAGGPAPSGRAGARWRRRPASGT